MKLVAHDGAGHGPGRRAAGDLRYTRAGPTFTYRLHAHGLRPIQHYTLLYLPKPAAGQLMCLGTGTTNRGGALRLHGSPDLNSDLPVSADANHPRGARIVLALASDVDCHNRRMTTWDPTSYLFGHKLIRYHDTDSVADHSGGYCVVTARPGHKGSLEIQISQTGTTVTITNGGLSATGTLSGQTATLTGTLPEGAFTIVLSFAADGESFTGTLTTGSEVTELSGSRGHCTDYEFPPGDPVCDLPVPDPGLVTGGQQYHSVTAGVTHVGLDFKFTTPLPAIVAPCDGVVVEITRHAITLGNIIVGVVIKYNDDWTTLLAFEPYSPDPAIADEQESRIAVEVNQVVRRGDLLGHVVVPVPSTGLAHVHWGVSRSDAAQTPVCPRDTLTPERRDVLDALYGSFGLLPVCLP